MSRIAQLVVGTILVVAGLSLWISTAPHPAEHGGRVVISFVLMFSGGYLAAGILRKGD